MSRRWNKRSFLLSPLFFVALTLDLVSMTTKAVYEKSTQFKGRDAVLNCPSLPQANIWLKEGKVLSIDTNLIGTNDVNKYIPNPHSGPRRNSSFPVNGFDLVIRTVKFGDAGVYGCQWKTFQKALKLVVVSKPKCSSILPTYKEGQSVTLTCDVTSNGDYETEVDWLQVREGVDGGMKLRMICTDNHPLRIPKVNSWGQGKGPGQGGRGGAESAPLQPVRPEPGGGTKTFTINSKCTIPALRSYHHDSQFLCRIRRKDLKPDLLDDARAEASSCSPGVFNVHFKPQFRCPDEQQFEGDSSVITIFCDVIANPFTDDDVKMHWKFNGRPVSPRNISAYEIPHGRRSKVTLANGGDMDEKVITLVVFRESHFEEKTIEKKIIIKRRKVAMMDWRLIAGIAGGGALGLLIFIYCLWRCKQKDDDYDSEADEKEKEMEMIPRRQQKQQQQQQQPIPAIHQFQQPHQTINNNRKYQFGSQNQLDMTNPYEEELKWRLQDFDSGYGQPINDFGDSSDRQSTAFKLEKKISLDRESTLDRQSTPSFMYRVEPVGSDSCSTYQDSIPSTSTFMPNGGVVSSVLGNGGVGNGVAGNGGVGYGGLVGNVGFTRTFPAQTPSPNAPNGGFSVVRPAPAAPGTPVSSAAPRIPSTISAFTPAAATAAAAAATSPISAMVEPNPALQQQQQQQRQRQPQQQTVPPPPPPPPKPRIRTSFRQSVSPSLCDTPPSAPPSAAPSAPSSPQSSSIAGAAPIPTDGSDDAEVVVVVPQTMTMTMKTKNTTTPITTTTTTTLPTKAANASSKSKYYRSHSYTKSMGRNDAQV